MRQSSRMLHYSTLNNSRYRNNFSFIAAVYFGYKTWIQNTPAWRYPRCQLKLVAVKRSSHKSTGEDERELWWFWRYKVEEEVCESISLSLRSFGLRRGDGIVACWLLRHPCHWCFVSLRVLSFAIQNYWVNSQPWSSLYSSSFPSHQLLRLQPKARKLLHWTLRWEIGRPSLLLLELPSLLLFLWSPTLVPWDRKVWMILLRRKCLVSVDLWCVIFVHRHLQISSYTSRTICSYPLLNPLLNLSLTCAHIGGNLVFPLPQRKQPALLVTPTLVPKWRRPSHPRSVWLLNVRAPSLVWILTLLRLRSIVLLFLDWPTLLAQREIHSSKEVIVGGWGSWQKRLVFLSEAL